MKVLARSTPTIVNAAFNPLQMWDGRKGSLGPNPPLLGLQKAPALKNHSPEYVVGARGYKPNAQAVA